MRRASKSTWQDGPMPVRDDHEPDLEDPAGPVRGGWATEIERLKAVPPEMLDRYLQRVLVADSLAAVFED